MPGDSHRQDRHFNSTLGFHQGTARKQLHSNFSKFTIRDFDQRSIWIGTVCAQQLYYLPSYYHMHSRLLLLLTIISLIAHYPNSVSHRVSYARKQKIRDGSDSRNAVYLYIYVSSLCDIAEISYFPEWEPQAPKIVPHCEDTPLEKISGSSVETMASGVRQSMIRIW